MTLANLLALQKSKKPVTPAAPDSHSVVAGVESESQAGASSPSLPPPAPPKGLRLNLIGRKPAPVPESKPASVSEEFSLQDLAAMEASEAAPNSISESATNRSEFVDEIEATAPDRDLPADITKEQLAFVESLDSIYEVLHDAEMFGQMVRTIMQELAENDELKCLLSDPDIHVMIRGMRRTMGLARVRKQEKSRKGKTQGNARAKSAVSDDAMQLLNSLMSDD